MLSGLEDVQQVVGIDALKKEIGRSESKYNALLVGGGDQKGETCKYNGGGLLVAFFQYVLPPEEANYVSHQAQTVSSQVKLTSGISCTNA